jgi:hypothetical protein
MFVDLAEIFWEKVFYGLGQGHSGILARDCRQKDQCPYIVYS